MGTIMKALQWYVLSSSVFLYGQELRLSEHRSDSAVESNGIVRAIMIAASFEWRVCGT